MKKWLAALMACVLLITPVLSFAEESLQQPNAVTTDLTALMDADALESWMTKLMASMGLPEDQEVTKTIHSMAAAISSICSASDLRVSLQPNGIFCALLMQEEEVLNLQIDAQDNQLLISTNLLPTHVLTLPMADFQLPELLQSAMTVDWQNLGEHLWQVYTEWYASMRPVNEYGSFMGDAYTDGTWRETIMPDDRDLALLVDGFAMVIEEHADVMALFDRIVGEGRGEELLMQLYAYNRQVSKENQYHYTVSTVYGDKHDMPIGFSFTAMMDDALQGTLSVGLGTYDCSAVLGMLSGSSMVYTAFGLSINETQDGTMLTGNTSSSIGSPEQSYAAATPISTMDFSQLFQMKENGMTSTADVTSTVNVPSIAAEMKMITKGTTDITFAPFAALSTMTMTMDGEENPILVVSESMRESEPFAAAATEGKTVVDITTTMSDDAQSELNTALQDGVSTLMINLFKYVPSEAISSILNLMNVMPMTTQP